MIKNGKEYVLESSEEAVELHLDMWRDMQKDLGDTPNSGERFDYKRKWLIKHGYDRVYNDCFLCEFARVACFSHGRFRLNNCAFCPIDWSSLSKHGWDTCGDRYIHGKSDIYLCAPISEILALPVKGE